MAVKGAIHIILDTDPVIKPEVKIDGEWTHRQIISLPQFIFKAFREYMRDKKASILKETSDDDSD